MLLTILLPAFAITFCFRVVRLCRQGGSFSQLPGMGMDGLNQVIISILPSPFLVILGGRLKHCLIHCMIECLIFVIAMHLATWSCYMSLTYDDQWDMLLYEACISMVLYNPLLCLQIALSIDQLMWPAHTFLAILQPLAFRYGWLAFSCLSIGFLGALPLDALSSLAHFLTWTIPSHLDKSVNPS